MVFHGFKNFEAYEASYKEVIIKWSNLFKTSKETNKNGEEVKIKKAWHGVKQDEKHRQVMVLYIRLLDVKPKTKSPKTSKR